MALSVTGEFDEKPDSLEFTLAEGVTSFNGSDKSRTVDALDCFDTIDVTGGNWAFWDANRDDDAMTLYYDSSAQTLTLRYGVVPEPTTPALTLLALSALALRRRRIRN